MKKKPWFLAPVLLLIVLMSILYFTRDSYVSRTINMSSAESALESGLSLRKSSHRTSFKLSRKESQTSQAASEATLSGTIVITKESQASIKSGTTVASEKTTETKANPEKSEKRPTKPDSRPSLPPLTNPDSEEELIPTSQAVQSHEPSPKPPVPKPSPTPSPIASPTPEPTPAPSPAPPETTSRSIDWSPYIGNSGMCWEIGIYGKDQAEQMAIDYVNEQLPLMFDPKSQWYGYDGARRYTTAEWLDHCGIWTVEFYKLDN